MLQEKVHDLNVRGAMEKFSMGMTVHRKEDAVCVEASRVIMEDTTEFKATLLSWKTLRMQVSSFERGDWEGDLVELICQI